MNRIRTGWMAVAGLALLCGCVTSGPAGGGRLAALAGEKTLRMAPVDYDGVRVEGTSEKDFLAASSRKDARDVENWHEAKRVKYPARFMELCNRVLEKVDVVVSEDAKDAKYSVVVKVLSIDPGWNVGIMRRPAMTQFRVSIVETANPNAVLYSVDRSYPGADAWGYDFDQTYRISESFAKCGKEVGKILLKQAYR